MQPREESGGKAGRVEHGVNGGVELVESELDGRRCVEGDTEVVRLEARAEQPHAELGQEEGDAAAVRGQFVTEGSGRALEQPFAGEAPEVVAHLAGGVLIIRDAEELGDQGAELAVGDPVRPEREDAQRLQQSVDARLAELSRNEDLSRYIL